MDSRERAALVRKGNELFNRGEIKEAIEIFVKTGYKDGLHRVGDFYFYDKKLPLIALKFYRLAGDRGKINEIMERMVYALGRWIREDNGSDESKYRVELPPLKVSPKLKIAAREILEKQGIDPDSTSE